MIYKLIIFTFSLSIIFVSCSSEENTEKKLKNDSVDTETIQIQPIVDTITINTLNIDTLKSTASEKKEVKVFKYICPLGDKEGNSDKEGICPTCEMELIENPDYTK